MIRLIFHASSIAVKLVSVDAELNKEKGIIYFIKIDPCVETLCYFESSVSGMFLWKFTCY